MSMANSGHEHTISDVLVAVVKRRDSFSVRKYIDPPVSPNAIIVSSSRQLSDSHLCRPRHNENPVRSTEAMMKRKVNICAGDNPLIINNFVHTKVVPHTATVRNATI